MVVVVVHVVVVIACGGGGCMQFAQTDVHTGGTHMHRCCRHTETNSHTYIHAHTCL